MFSASVDNFKKDNISCANSQYFDSVIFQIIYKGTRQCLTEQQLTIYGILLKIFFRGHELYPTSMKNPGLHAIIAISTFFIASGRGKRRCLLNSSVKKRRFLVYHFLNFILRKRVTFAKYVSEKKGDFWFIVF